MSEFWSWDKGGFWSNFWGWYEGTGGQKNGWTWLGWNVSLEWALAFPPLLAAQLSIWDAALRKERLDRIEADWEFSKLPGKTLDLNFTLYRSNPAVFPLLENSQKLPQAKFIWILEGSYGRSQISVGGGMYVGPDLILTHSTPAGLFNGRALNNHHSG